MTGTLKYGTTWEASGYYIGGFTLKKTDQAHIIRYSLYGIITQEIPEAFRLCQQMPHFLTVYESSSKMT